LAYNTAFAYKCLGYLKKEQYCDVTSGYQRYRIFCQFMRNAYLDKVRLNQVKIIYYLKFIKK